MVAKGEGLREKATQPREESSGSSGKEREKLEAKPDLGTTPFPSQITGKCYKEGSHRLSALGDKGCRALMRSPLSLSETAVSHLARGGT